MNEYEVQDWRIQRLKAAVDHYTKTGKKGASGLGRDIGAKDGAFIRQMVSGKRSITEKTIWSIEALPGMKDWFTPTWKEVREPEPKNTGAVLVPVLANVASMGPGHDTTEGDVLKGSLLLSADWTQKNLNISNHDRLRFIQAYGDSMEPTFSSGDILLVDTATKSVKIDGIYVLEAHERLFVKRVRQRMDGSYEISSDNPTHKTVDTLNGDHTVHIKGRIVWAWNGKRL